MNTLEALVDATLAIEKERVAMEVRRSHLKRESREDPETDEVLKRLVGVEEYIDGRIGKLLELHLAYPWFSRVLGVGKENIGKVVGNFRVKPEKGWRKNKETKKLELVDLPYAHYISGLWAFAGFDVDPETNKAPKRTAGEKLGYNSQLRSMCWRLATSLLMAGLRQRCAKCRALFGATDTTKDAGGKTTQKTREECPKCGSTDFGIVAVSKFAQFFLDQKALLYARYAAEGTKIVPAESLPKNKEGKKYEPAGVISEGHVHNQAVRKMIKLFLACLWLVWREAEGLPATKPYAIDKLGHSSFIDPWEMVDKEARSVEKPRKKKRAIVKE